MLLKYSILNLYSHKYKYRYNFAVVYEAGIMAGLSKLREVAAPFSSSCITLKKCRLSDQAVARLYVPKTKSNQKRNTASEMKRSEALSFC